MFSEKLHIYIYILNKPQQLKGKIYAVAAMGDSFLKRGYRSKKRGYSTIWPIATFFNVA